MIRLTPLKYLLWEEIQHSPMGFQANQQTLRRMTRWVVW